MYKQIGFYENLIKEYQDKLENLRKVKEKELIESGGFLVEFDIFWRMIFGGTGNRAVFIVWCLFFSFFLFIELFVVTNKVFDGESEYDLILKHQFEMRKRQMNKLLTNES